MKIKLILLGISSSLVLAAPALLAQNTNTNTNSLPLTQTVKYQVALENDRSLGERSLLSPGLKEKMKLTDEQRTELKPIEEDFANTSQQYQKANQPRIDAAQDAIRRARESKDTAQIQAAREQLQAGLGRSPAIPGHSHQASQAAADAGSNHDSGGSEKPMARKPCC